MRRTGLVATGVTAVAYLALISIGVAADQAPQLTVFWKSVTSDASVTLHRDGEAIPIGAEYRIHVRHRDQEPITIKAVFPDGIEKTLFSGPAPAAPLELPQGGGWYEVPGNSGTVTIVSTQATEVNAHLLRVVDASPAAEVRHWRKDDAVSSRTGADGIYHLPSSSPELPREVAQFGRIASAFANAKEPVLRGGEGARIFRDTAAGVVLIVVGDGTGSGIVLNQAGQILTNWHVVRGAQSIGVMLKPPAGQRLQPTDMYQAHLKKYDEVADLAVIELEHGPNNLVALKLGDERRIEVGSTVHAIGHPSGEYWTYTEGIVSQVRTDYEWSGADKLKHSATVIQTQTPINPGNSGGPLLDDGGNVIGINSFSETGKQGLNFAISIADVKRFMLAGGNRLSDAAPDTTRTDKPKREGCDPHRYDSFIDQKTKKLVIPVDTECRGRPNLYLIGEQADKPPEFALIDDVGDGKFDAKVIFHFDGKADLWIFYAKRDGVATAFGYDYEAKGKPDLVVAVKAVSQ